MVWTVKSGLVIKGPTVLVAMALCTNVLLVMK